ncbi:MAG: helix-turn-helix transcriptional regulator [Planctomycetaceae bacterium]|nr:helix-turn-helix transcriptional regulator [Planctomycetales bacterium]MCB9925519.1 helix-turn-helix transcriptional regulator [Planctomycetaceae bacterium]
MTTDGLGLFLGNMFDTCIVDPKRASMVRQLCEHRSPFQGIASYPWLDEALANHSARVLRKMGEDEWVKAGGILDTNGQPYCKRSSLIAQYVVSKLAEGSGGLLWRDNQGISWAVRLAKDHRGDGKQYHAFCVNWGGNPLLLDQEARRKIEADANDQLPKLDDADRSLSSQGLQTVTRNLRLFDRGEQLLWLIHATVLSQRSSVITLPDIQCGEVIWGGDRQKWPQNWRREIIHILRSLMHIRTERLVIGKNGWNPRFGAESVAVAHIEDMKRTESGNDRCLDSCPMFLSGVSHNHFVVQIGLGFLGVLEKFLVTKDERGERTYDFSSSKVREVRKAGTDIVTASLPSKILGGAKWAEISKNERRILDALTLELTRDPKSQRNDKAHVYEGNKVVGRKPGVLVECPLLVPSDRYVVFGGNGKRSGCGYQVVGRKGTGWLYKCGDYIVSKDAAQLRREIRAFMNDLCELSSKFGLIPAAIDKNSNRWIGIEDLKRLAHNQSGVARLKAFQLRVFAPEDWSERIRAYFAAKGGFNEVPTIETSPGSMADCEQHECLSDRVRRLGIKQGQLAREIGVSRSQLTNLLNGARRWSPAVLARCKAYLQKVELGSPELET